MSDGDHRPAAPFDPAAHPHPFAGKPLDVDTGRRERRNVLGSMLMVTSPKLR
jgi:hypothetical protein